jgi:hypothetical protein
MAAASKKRRKKNKPKRLKNTKQTGVLARSKKRGVPIKKRHPPPARKQVPTQLFVVHNDKKAQAWVFTKHEDALRCREEQKLDQSHLWGCSLDCYIFKDEPK